MAITKKYDRQYELTAVQEFTFEDLVSGEALEMVALPANAIVTGGELFLSTLFNSVTSDTILIGDAADPDRYAAGIDGKATARTALTPTGAKYATSDDVTLTWTGVGAAPTQGKGLLVVRYIRPGRSQEVME